MPMRARRTDTNHQAIVRALRKVGWHVTDASHVGNGFPDLVIAKAGRIVLVEVKDGARPPSERKLTALERMVHLAFAEQGVIVAIVASEDEAVRL